MNESPDQDRVDPIVYLRMMEPNGEAGSALRAQIYKYRHRLYRLFKKIIPRPSQEERRSPITDEEEAQVFDAFLSTMVQDYSIHYGIAMYALHLYLIVLFWNRVLYCPAIESDEQSSGNIFTYLFSQLISLIYSSSFGTTCDTRPPAFVDFVGWNLAVFYTATFITYHVSPALEAYILNFFSFWINGLVTGAFWFVSGDQGWILNGSGPLSQAHGHDTRMIQEKSRNHMHAMMLPEKLKDGSFYSLYGRWNAVFTPLLFWWLYLIGRRNKLGIIQWEYRTSLTDFEDEQDKDGRDVSAEHKAIHDRNVRCRAWIAFAYRIWQVLSSFLGLFMWKWWILQQNSDSSHEFLLSLTDMFPFPSRWFIALISFSCTAGLLMWFSYLNFQHQCIFWFIPFHEGFVINSFENEVRLGLVY